MSIVLAVVGVYLGSGQIQRHQCIPSFRGMARLLWVLPPAYMQARSLCGQRTLRLDALVSQRAGVSKRRARELIEQGCVSLGGRPVRPVRLPRFVALLTPSA